MRTFAAIMLGILALMVATSGYPVSATNGHYPRIANLWGAEVSSQDFDQWSKYDMLILGGGGKEPWMKFAKEVRARNPRIILLGTSPFQNVGAPKDSPWMKDEWYLRRPNGEILSWWVGQLYAPNLFKTEYLDAAVRQADAGYGEIIRSGSASGFMFDSVVGQTRWYGEVDTDRDGVADNPEEIDQKWQQQQNVFFDKLNKRLPNALVIANNIDLRHAPCANGRLFEGYTLLDLVSAGYASPQQTIFTLREWMSRSRQPGIAFAIMSHPVGWGWWRLGKTGKADALTTLGELDRVKRDFPRMRVGLLTTMMSDAYYYYDFGTTWYGHHMWYAEYDAPLGQPLKDMKEVFTSRTRTVLEWKPGQSTDIFTFPSSGKVSPDGLELDNGVENSGSVQMLEIGPAKVHFHPGKTYRIAADFQVVRRAKEYFQLILRTPNGGKDHDKGWMQCTAEAGEPWHAEATLTPDNFDDYRLELNRKGSGALKLIGMKIFEMKDSYLIREFQGGAALLNPMPHGVTVKLDRPMRRLKDDAAPRYITEVDDVTPDAAERANWETYLQKYRDVTRLTIKAEFAAGSGWEFVKQDGHQYGEGYHTAQKPGASASWKIVPPSTDSYSVYAWMMGGSDLADAAMYSLTGPGVGESTTIDQRKYNGEWVRLYNVKLRKGKSYEIKLRSTGKGNTVADAIRIESATRFNDGRIVNKVQLDALDGIVLLNSSDEKEKTR